MSHGLKARYADRITCDDTNPKKRRRITSTKPPTKRKREDAQLSNTTKSETRASKKRRIQLQKIQQKINKEPHPKSEHDRMLDDFILPPDEEEIIRSIMEYMTKKKQRELNESLNKLTP